MQLSMIKELSDSKIVLFGTGNNGRKMLEMLINANIVPAYFVDNNPNNKTVDYSRCDGKVEPFSVNMPKVLLSEDKAKLKIIITPAEPTYMEIETQLRGMGLEQCVFSGSFCPACEECANVFTFWHNSTEECTVYKVRSDGETQVFIALF